MPKFSILVKRKTAMGRNMSRATSWNNCNRDLMNPNPVKRVDMQLLKRYYMNWWFTNLIQYSFVILLNNLLSPVHCNNVKKTFACLLLRIILLYITFPFSVHLHHLSCHFPPYNINVPRRPLLLVICHFSGFPALLLFLLMWCQMVL